ncbi:uncharacterized protein SPAPADRAFT_63745 [Spathaspora passalidarum NRRL Y-27907]|uniref:Extradiol ring-cleavage dioxygenase class III enzyme subunit B domain-containing protein n=1 Tax=Spathaspora passalidarum (strain NRRL Y-27907 / 11-Y1) TaxID=619300 RepID=G3AVB4_SPAPN|nr:uncharacterized protein SPAPADRAFT_63745 [Spathaspora passalidarum NRRL Y-27907]EGW30132.1 hypothetical protein SPAPADRAFT_63745 [Spathaspora passalidarum NRRL Y-27907]
MNLIYTFLSILLPALTYYYYSNKPATTTSTPAISVAPQFTTKVTPQVTEMSSIAKYIKNPTPFPAYFFSHGGPTFMYEDDDFGNKGAWRTVKKIGTKIKNQWKPDYIIVVSAHWQSSGSNLIEISVPSTEDGENKLIYDFGGFPNHMYKEEFHTKGSWFVAEQIRQHLENNKFHSRISKGRGIDHGTWVPFKVAFSDYNTQTKPQPEVKGLDLEETAVIQVSLTSNDKDFETHFKLGQALSKFKNELLWDESKKKYLTGLIVCSGMSVHNLYDLGRAFQQYGGLMPYTKPFNKELTNLVEKSSKDELLPNFLELKKKDILRQAHPTLEHFLPIVVAGGIANQSDEPIKEVYNDAFASLGWGIYQVGNYKKPEATL